MNIFDVRRDGLNAARIQPYRVTRWLQPAGGHRRAADIVDSAAGCSCGPPVVLIQRVKAAYQHAFNAQLVVFQQCVRHLVWGSHQRRRIMSASMNYDLSQHDPDALFPDIFERISGSKGRFEYVINQARREGKTLALPLEK